MRNSAALYLVLSLAALSTAHGQQYLISTIAGGGVAPLLKTPARGVDLPIGAVYNIATDAAGNAYFPSGHSIFKLDQNGIVTSVAGTSHAGYSGDGGPATNAQLIYPGGVTVDSTGNLFFVDGSYRVRRVAPSGTIATVAGNGTQGYSGDGGPAVNAQLRYPYAIAVDAAGSLFITDDKSIRKVTTTGIISTLAGNGTQGFSGDGGPAVSAQLNYPSSLAVDKDGNLFIADSYNSRVRKVSPDGIITTVAGNGGSGFTGDGGPATDATFLDLQGIAIDQAGNLYIVDCDYDSGNARIRKVSTGGVITTVAGNGTTGFSGDGGPATSAQLSGAEAVAVDAAGNIYIADSYNNRLRKVTPDGIINTVAGANAASLSSSGDGGPATSAQLGIPHGVVVDAAGNLYIADGRLQKVTPDGIINTVANVSGTSLAMDAAGNLFTTTPGAVEKISPSGAITSIIQLSGNGIAVDGAGNLFVGAGGLVYKISPNGIRTTVAGGGKIIPNDGGPATGAQLNNVTGVALDGEGNLYFSETYGHRVRKVTPNGTITTVAGTGGEGFSGDGGPATTAELNGPDGLAFDAAGNLYIADTYNSRIRVVTADGIIHTIAGTGVLNPSGGYSGDGGLATVAQLRYPWGVAVDQQGNVYVADTFDSVVRLLRPTHNSVFISSVVDAASQQSSPVSPGKIVVIYGAGMGPAKLAQNQASNGQISNQVGGTTVSINGIAAPVLYASATQVAAIVPYAVSGSSAQVNVAYNGQTSPSFPVPLAPSAPAIFTSNQTGAGQIAAVHAVDGTINSAVNPVKVGAYVSFYATGEGQTSPAGVDGKVNSSTPPTPVLPVTVTVGGMRAFVQYAGEAPGQVAGLIQINVQIPTGVQPGGYVPVILKVGDASTTPDAVWIAVSGNQ